MKLAGKINGFWGVKICLEGKKIKKYKSWKERMTKKSKGFLSVREERSSTAPRKLKKVTKHRYRIKINERGKP